jgi:hypothetical protein
MILKLRCLLEEYSKMSNEKTITNQFKRNARRLQAVRTATGNDVVMTLQDLENLRREGILSEERYSYLLSFKKEYDQLLREQQELLRYLPRLQTLDSALTCLSDQMAKLSIQHLFLTLEE